MNGRNSTSYIYYGLVFKGGLVFNRGLTKTNTPKFTVKFDLKLGGKNRREDNLTDLILGGLSFRNLEN